MQLFKQEDFWLSSELSADEALAVIKANTNLPTTFSLDLIPIGRDRYFVGNIEGNSFDVTWNSILKDERMANALTSIKGEIYADGAQSRIHIVVVNTSKKNYILGIAIFISLNIVISVFDHSMDIFGSILLFAVFICLVFLLGPILFHYQVKNLKKKLCELFDAKELLSQGNA